MDSYCKKPTSTISNNGAIDSGKQTKTVILSAFLAIALVGCSSMPSGYSNKPNNSDFIERSTSLPFLGLPTPSSAEEAITNGDSAFTQSDYNRALFEYVRALDLDDKNPDIYIKIAKTHDKMRHYNIAHLAYIEALKLDTKNITALENTSVFFMRQNNTAQAKHYASKAIANYINATQSKQQNAIFPVSAYTSMGIIMDLENNHQQALNHYKVVLNNAPNNPSIHNNIGYSYYLSGDIRTAERHFKSAIELDTSYSLAWKNLGLVYARQSRYMESLNAFEQVFTKAKAYNDLGYICLINDRFTEAEFFLKRAIDLNPKYYKTAEENLAMVQWHSNLSRHAKQPSHEEADKTE